MKRILTALAAVALSNASATEPQLTPQSRFIDVPPQYTASEVSDGMIRIGDGQSGVFGFYDLEGEVQWPLVWQGGPGLEGRFDAGACVVRDRNGDHCILYKDGRARRLPGYIWVSNLCDGLALALRRDSASKQIWAVYIDHDGNELYDFSISKTTGSEALPARFEAPRPMCEGLRAYYDYEKGLWGFIETMGLIVIPPSFLEVDRFVESECLVRTPDGEGWLIDKTGRLLRRAPFEPVQQPCDEELRHLRTAAADGYVDAQERYVLVLRPTPDFATAPEAEPIYTSAPYQAALYPIRVACIPAEGGSVLPQAGAYPYGTELRIEARPYEGYRFVEWRVAGERVSTERLYRHIVRKSGNVLEARFAPAGRPAPQR